VEESVRRFNRSNREYYVEIWEYDQQTDALEAMLYDPRGIPDILEVSSIQTEILESKGLLENLEPYLARSDSIKAEDLLDALWRAEQKNGEVTALTTRFSIATLVSTAEGVDSSGWSVENFLEKAQEAQENFLLYQNEHNMVRFILQANLNHFVDFETGECSFDSPEFISLLEQLAQISYPEDGESVRSYNSINQQQEALLRGEGQVKEEFFPSLSWYLQTMKTYGTKAVIAGYPTLDGSSCCVLYPTEQYAVYSGSENPDGAWAYLESVLSKEQQLRYAYLDNGIPVRKDVMEIYLAQPVASGEYLSEENRVLFEKMLDELVLPQYTNSALLSILWEELDAFFAGDRTAARTAAVLQNRAQLYLDENFWQQ
jgi:ABC-type glycerol-3-phosphate transport system substrate-binding protein